MKKHGIGSRLLSALLALVMILTVLPVMKTEAAFSGSYEIKSNAHGMGLTSKDYITMPIKIMDYESDGMFFDYLFGAGHSSLTSASQYEPEGNYWIDFTNTLSAGTANGNIRIGSGMDKDVNVPSAAGTKSWRNLSLKAEFPTMGGKQVLKVTRTMTTDVPLMWNMCSFNGAVPISKIRYMTIAYVDFTRASTSEPPRMGVSIALDDDMSRRYQAGGFSNWYYLDPGEVGKWGIEVAVIDLHDGGKGIPLTQTVQDLYLNFPMGPNDNQSFIIAGLGCFENYGDAEQFGYWAASAGSMSNTDTATYLKAGASSCTTVPKDSFNNDNQGFSMLVQTRSSTFGAVSSVADYIAAQSSTTAGQQPLFIAGTKNLATDSAKPYQGTAMKWANNATSVNISTAIGYKLFQTIGDTQSNGYATVGLVESSLDDRGLPVYKESVLNYMQTFLRNRLINSLDRDYDGWMYYSSIRGARNGEIFGYMDGGQRDMDPETPGVQGVPMDFATAICENWGINRNARDINGKTDRNRGTVGSYAQTMAKRKYLEGSWLDCKEYITTWWDLAYYMMHNFWVPNSYNQLQSEYNYLNLYKSTNTSSTSNGHYVFDSKLTQVNGSPYTTAVTYDKTNKTIGHAGATYQAYFGSYEAYNPFTPVNYGDGAAGESTNHYYFDDGVNVFSAFGGNLWYNNKNYNYSLVCNGEFDFKESDNLMFHFDGDDDVYLFINGELVMDLGATHNNTASTIYLNDYLEWAETVLAKRWNYTLAEVERAEKLALKDGETYSFDFYYMERHGTGANLRIETNINVVVPELEVNKVASQAGVEVPDNGVVDNTRPVEYGFSLTNDDDTSKLYNISFIDSAIGVEVSPEKGLVVNNTAQTKNKNGEPLQASDLVAYVDGYDGDPSRPRTKKLDTITVTFANNEELKQFLTNLTSDDGTATDVSDSLYSGDGLWAYATVTLRGFYYTQTDAQQGNAFFTNPVTAYAYNGAHKLTGSDTHTVYAFGEPSYFQWAGHKIVIDSEKLYSDLKSSKTYKNHEIPKPGHMQMTLTDSMGTPVAYPYVSNTPGGDVYLEVNYPDPGMYTVYLNVADKMGKIPTLNIALVFYVMDVKDSAVVLDYGLTADLSDGNGLFSGDVVSLTDKETHNTVMAITGVTAEPSYVEQDVSNLHGVVNTGNGVTMLEGTSVSSYRGKLETPIYLRHDIPWVIDWETKGNIPSCLLFSMEEVGATADNLYIFLRNNGSDSEAAPDFVALGRYHNGGYDNHGVSLNAAGKNMNTAQKYRLLNRPFTDGTNKVILYVAPVGTEDYTEVGELNTWWINSTLQTEASTFISGKDFTFNYIGTPTHPVNLTYLKSITVYEQGLERNNYRWEYNSATDKVEAVSTNDPGNVLNPNAWKPSTTSQDTDGYYGALTDWVELSSSKQWAIEFKLSGIYDADDPRNKDGATGEVMLMSSYHTTEHEYLYLKADVGLVCFGTSDAAGYHNYGIALKNIIPGFTMADEHVYRVEHRIHANGTSMAYLIVDGQEIGPMNNYFSSSFAIDGQTGDMFSGNNMMFCYLGYSRGHWPIDCTVHYLQVWEDTALSGTFGWEVENVRVQDAATGDKHGNRINFTGDRTYGVIDTYGRIPGDEGVFIFDNGKLTFTPDEFMEGGSNTVKVAVTVHDRDAIPTPLSEQTVDIANEVQMFKNISVIPATVVYYEDDFPSLSYVGTEGNTFTVIDGVMKDKEQNAHYDTNYGSDSAYTDSHDDISGDSIHKIKIDKQGALASFQFTGTGFELVAKTNAVDAASIYLTVYTGDATVSANGTVTGGSQKAVVPVITQFDNQNNLGAEEVYQVPVIRWESGEAATGYTVVINGVPSYEYDANGKRGDVKDTFLYIDGLRIYQPLGASHSGYRDVENDAVFTEIREKIVEGAFAASSVSDDGVTIGSGLTVFSENLNGEFVGNEVQYATDYLMVGPNNEVYLDGSFTRSALLMLVKEDGKGVHDLQIGAHAMDYGKFLGAGYTGLGVVLQYGVKDGNGYAWKTLTTLTGLAEQYYTVPYTECPVVDGYYQVALRAAVMEEDVPALAAFTSVKTNGLTFGSFNRTSGALSGNIWLKTAGALSMSTAVWTGNESVPGDSFLPGDTQGPAVTPKYPTLSFEEEIKYNIYFTVSDLGSFTAGDLGLAIFDGQQQDGTVDTATRLITGASVSGDCYVLQTDGIAAKNLGDKVWFKLYAKLADGSYVYSNLYGYSALDYAKEQLQRSSDLKLKQLMVAMLNYGAAAQQYFGYRAEAPMNAFLLDGDQSIAEGYRADMVKPLTKVDAAKAGIFGQNVSGFAGKYPSVSFGGAFSMNYYFTPTADVDSITFYYWTAEAYEQAEVLTPGNASGKQTMSDVGDGSFMAAIHGIAAKNLSDNIFVAATYEADGVTCSTGILRYSLGAYCAQKAASGSEAMTRFASVTAVYGYYAENYFA